jgi:hypothetical protein
LFKNLKKKLSHPYYRTVESYTTERLFQVKFKKQTTRLRKIVAGVPQRSVLGPVLYLIYTSDLPTSDNNTTATFADDTALLVTQEEPAIASTKLQVVDQ